MTNAMAATFQINSTSFKEGERIPAQYSCDGQDISPQLAWVNAPANTQSFALICADPDAPVGMWYHWVVFNISKSVAAIAENNIPENSVLGENSWGRAQYNGPCPPPGKPHHYIFTIYALDTKLNLPSRSNAEILKKAMQSHILGSATITGLFGR